MPGNMECFELERQSEAMYEIKVWLANDKAMVLDTSNPDLLKPVSMGLSYGWYLSTSALDEVEVRMNKELFHLEENGVIKSIVSRAWMHLAVVCVRCLLHHKS